MTAHAAVSPTRPSDCSAGTSGFATCALHGGHQAAGVARHFTRSTLQSWGMAALADDVETIVSEMLSNAIRHGLPCPEQLPSAPRLVGLGLLRRGATVLCAVSDPSTDVPVVLERTRSAASGRGLHIIDALSESWGWTPPGRRGKTVWATVSAYAPGRTTRRAVPPCE